MRGEGVTQELPKAIAPSAMSGQLSAAEKRRSAAFSPVATPALNKRRLGEETVDVEAAAAATGDGGASGPKPKLCLPKA